MAEPQRRVHRAPPEPERSDPAAASSGAGRGGPQGRGGQGGRRAGEGREADCPRGSSGEEGRAEGSSRPPRSRRRRPSAQKAARKPATEGCTQAGPDADRESQPASRAPAQASRPAEQRTGHEAHRCARQPRRKSHRAGRSRHRRAQQPAATGTPVGSPAKKAAKPRRTRRAQLRLVQVDAWSVMKTSFLLSIALGIVLVVAVAIIWAVLGAAGVWDSINSIVQQAVGGEGGALRHRGVRRHLPRPRLHDDRGRDRRHPDHRDRDPRRLPLQPLRGPPRRHRGHPRRGQLRPASAASTAPRSPFCGPRGHGVAFPLGPPGSSHGRTIPGL